MVVLLLDFKEIGLTDRHERDIYVHFKLGVKIRQIRHHSSPNFESRNFPEFSNPNPNPWSTSGAGHAIL